MLCCPWSVPHDMRWLNKAMGRAVLVTVVTVLKAKRCFILATKQHHVIGLSRGPQELVETWLGSANIQGLHLHRRRKSNNSDSLCTTCDRGSRTIHTWVNVTCHRAVHFTLFRAFGVHSVLTSWFVCVNPAFSTSTVTKKGVFWQSRHFVSCWTCINTLYRQSPLKTNSVCEKLRFTNGRLKKP